MRGTGPKPAGASPLPWLVSLQLALKWKRTHAQEPAPVLAPMTVLALALALVLGLVLALALVPALLSTQGS